VFDRFYEGILKNQRGKVVKTIMLLLASDTGLSSFCRIVYNGWKTQGFSIRGVLIGRFRDKDITYRRGSDRDIFTPPPPLPDSVYFF